MIKQETFGRSPPKQDHSLNRRRDPSSSRKVGSPLCHRHTQASVAQANNPYRADARRQSASEEKVTTRDPYKQRPSQREIPEFVAYPTIVTSSSWSTEDHVRKVPKKQGHPSVNKKKKKAPDSETTQARQKADPMGRYPISTLRTQQQVEVEVES